MVRVFWESIYEEALAWGLAQKGIPFERQKDVAVRYKGQAIGRHKLDLLVDGSLVVELKTVECLGDVHKAQVISCLRALKLPLGLLVNFIVPVLKDGLQRVVYGENDFRSWRPWRLGG